MEVFSVCEVVCADAIVGTTSTAATAPTIRIILFRIAPSLC
ncbi:MAG: hypothetical protein ABI601_14700 [bacterium]